MSREIKFRAWVDNANRMFGPFTLKELSDGRISVDEPDGRGYIFLDESDLMQYTGLKDKNGKEIYEGDICLIYEGESWTAEVSFVGAGFCFVNRNCCSVCAEGRGCIGPIDETGDPVEVIGNIYESPELLGESPGTPKETPK